MRTRGFVCGVLLSVTLAASPALGGTVSGLVSDATGAVLPGAKVVLKDLATGREIVAVTGQDGRYHVDTPEAGSFLIIVTRTGFADAARTVVLAKADDKVDLPLRLEVGTLKSEVSVTASRAERETKRLPLNVESISGAAIAAMNPLSTGDALTTAANITPVGNGPFGVRPRLRGLDSTRLLVLVDGERLNTARQATERTGAEVGLISADTISRMEVVNGAGTLMYGSDALAGTINIITNEPTFSAQRQYLYGLNTFYTSNEQSGRGTFTLGMTSSRVSFRVQGGAEKYDNYHAGALTEENTAPLFANGTLHRTDTIDTNFAGFHFNAFPDPFNAPYSRTSNEVLNSGAQGYFVNASGLIKLAEKRNLRLRYQQRRMENVGFADFADPYFFNATSLPHSDLDRFSARYEAQDVTPHLANLSVTAYYQRTQRLLENQLPVQFPAPTAGSFFPIAVFRLDILSDTQQRVWTPGVDAQAVWVPGKNHLLTTGLMLYRDKSSDARTTSTTMSMVGQVAMGQFGPAATVFPSPIVLGPPTVAHPVRVPDASLTNVGLFAQDEWRINQHMSLMTGIRGDYYGVTTEATPGYSVDPIVAGAVPPIDPATLPDPAGATYNRNALTGDVGLVINPGGSVNPFVRLGRSYRHPNLEEMLFSGPATVGNIAPNVLVRPETGTNLDFGAKFRIGRVSGGAYAFVNQYQDFIAQDLVVAVTPSGPLAQAINYADVRIGGIEASIDAPIVFRPGVVTLSAAGAFTRGTITAGTDPLTNTSLAGTPADNITPSKILANVRFTATNGRWWAEYGVRSQSEVTRVASSLLDSPFLIAQDLLSLEGFTVQRIGWGVNLTKSRDRVALTFAVENLANTYYREQFQFAPARGRSFTFGLTLGAF